MLEYLDIHTHRRVSTDDCISVECLSSDELIQGKLGKAHTTAGVHPWWLEDFTMAEIEAFKVQVFSLVKQGLVWGVGETGLDRTMPDLMEHQKKLFLWHMELANEFSLPLVIHNVRASSDFLEMMKNGNPQTPWIFHDFRGNEQAMRDLLRLHHQTYFSFGLSLDNSPQVRELLPHVPLENLFLETDNQKHLDIHDIYLRAAEQLDLDIEFLKSQIWQNFSKISPKRH